MIEHGQFWRNKALREHVAVIEGKIAPSLVFKHSIYLNMYTKKWETANIWIYGDRIVYVGEKMPTLTCGTEIIDATGQYFVPGYIEPHAHPFQLYNPEDYAIHAATYGTTTLVNDNMRMVHFSDKKKALSLVEEFHKMTVSLFWWARYDAQSMLRENDALFNTKDVLDWLDDPSVWQGGELTAWPQLLAGDDRLLYWIQETKKRGKRVEGHLPGASVDTLTKLKLLGISADHEAMNGEEVLQRLRLGYHAALRYSSIRPDLPNILDDLLAADIQNYDNLMFTTDGSTPTFNEKGLINKCIEIAINAGVPIEEAYRMGTYNVAKYFGKDELLGSIAPGRLAHINILYAKDDPTPLSVLAKGKWLVKDGVVQEQDQVIDWDKFGIKKATFDWELDAEDLQFSIPVGLKMENDVIMKPYAVQADITTEVLSKATDDAFLLFMDRYGKWRVNTVIDGFTRSLGGLCSSYSATGDLILIGKAKADMQLAWRRMKEIGGGIVLAHDGEIIYELPLALQGDMYVGGMQSLMAKENELKQLLKDHGFKYDDPVYTLLFIASTHLPFIRVTQLGIVDVLEQSVLVPANMR